MSCNNRTIGFAHAVTAHPTWAPAHGGTALCVKKSAKRKDRMKPWFRYRAHPRYYNRACALSKMATFVLTASPLSRLKSPAIPTAPHDFA